MIDNSGCGGGDALLGCFGWSFCGGEMVIHFEFVRL